MRRLVALLATFVEWLDAIVLVLILMAGSVLAAVMLLDGGEAMDLVLVAVVTAMAAVGWWRASWASEKLGRRWKR